MHATDAQLQRYIEGAMQQIEALKSEIRDNDEKVSQGKVQRVDARYANDDNRRSIRDAEETIKIIVEEIARRERDARRQGQISHHVEDTRRPRVVRGDTRHPCVVCRLRGHATQRQGVS
jgi:predicted  nucleic acid-binding Zn-ribbon protein